MLPAWQVQIGSPTTMANMQALRCMLELHRTTLLAVQEHPSQMLKSVYSECFVGNVLLGSRLNGFCPPED